ncbi:MAG: hypothetical protein EOP55_19605 [Sphingobacteriales bacterium]|nr:MAG: hypothetical protein EOP55_19605 [Sphingobacteriales bacterium]
MEDIKSYSLNSRKTPNPDHKFRWYANDVLGSICYLVEGDGSLISFNRFNTFNYLKTQNNDFCSSINSWMDILIKKSVSFSGNGEKQRNRYLNNANLDIQNLLNEINNG